MVLKNKIIFMGMFLFYLCHFNTLSLFFYRLLPREDIEALLRQDGDFVLRVTELRENVKKATRELCLSVYWKTNVHHYLIRPNNSKRYQICNPLPGERLPEFENVNKMITHYVEGKIVFSNHQVVLRTPISRQVIFLSFF